MEGLDASGARDIRTRSAAADRYDRFLGGLTSALSVHISCATEGFFIFSFPVVHLQVAKSIPSGDPNMASRASAGNIYIYVLNGCRFTDLRINGQWVTHRVEALPL
ncbi:hypothetical protein BSFA1_81370 (plasmid) [Burkholderia sp. SFA1]|nr:hypothetical protein BSFA1_81370 [Burkholderia sp. SFA1]